MFGHDLKGTPEIVSVRTRWVSDANRAVLVADDRLWTLR
jgi:hypothetical protein